MWKWLAGVGITLITLLRIVIFQRDKERQSAKQAKHEAEAAKAIRESEQRLNKAQREAQIKAKQVGDELNQNRDQRPAGNFGDSRIRLRQHNKD